MDQTTTLEVLTLEGVAAYLRLPVETIARQASRGQIPGRKVKETWRFLKAAIDDWLRSYDGRTLLLQQAGAFAGDETLEALRQSIYTARKRPEVEENPRA